MAILTRSVIHVPDIEDPSAFELTREAGRLLGYRSTLTVPMLREGEAMGAITVARREPGRFSDAEVQLLKTFADQAVIAIENVRLFKELEARNRDLTATSAILQVISSSPNDLGPVFEVMLANATQLCEAQTGLLFLYNGDVFELAAHRGASAEWLDYAKQGVGRSPGTGLWRMRAERRPVHIPDILTDPAYPDPQRTASVRMLRARTCLWVPMLKESTLVGAMVTYRQEVRPFSDEQIRLLQTFADQAVIAIENVR